MSIIAAGTRQDYTVVGEDALGNSLGDVTAATTLSISPNGTGTGAACDNTTHTCTATQSGTYTVTGSDGTARGTATLWVGPRFTQRPGLASSISVGRNGSVWMLGATSAGGNFRDLPLDRPQLGRGVRRGGQDRRRSQRQPVDHQLGPPPLPMER